ncbi:hypothetical protein [Hymenobacter coccineus]|uniref:hypothetical protein n=1 Tax=Hymenobacter coccineus TaxID=1908235 RepID=UPI000F78D188|nr:hypothetical protein [Hymenobacter coccineus]
MSTKKKRVVRVGLLGESPNDTAALKVLLQQKYKERIQVFTLLKNLKADKVAGPKALRMLPKQYAEQQPDIVVFTRDLDALASDVTQMQKRRNEFNAINLCVGGKGIFLLHIYEFEALIMAHIGPFNTLYKCTCNPQADPMRIIDPKGNLQEASRKGKRGEYSENDCEEVCAQLDYAELVKNCGYFRDFDAAFAAKLPK